MKRMTIAHIPDYHVGSKVLSCRSSYESIWLNICNTVNKYKNPLDLLVFGGDLYDTKFPSDSEEVELTKKIIKEATKLARIVVVMKGTEGHDRDMLEHLKPLSKFGDVYSLDTTRLESQIIDKVKRAKEIHISGNKESIMNDIEVLSKLLQKSVESSSEGNEVFIIDKPTFMNINGYNVLFHPEPYDVDDSNLSMLMDEHPDIVFFHGMLEGGIEHYHENKTELIYNKSVMFSHKNIKKVNMFVVSGHLHKRVGILPFTSHEVMSTSEQHGIRAWYTGSPYQSTFADANTKKGFDIIECYENTHQINFMELKHGPVFNIYNFTKIFRTPDMNKINGAVVNILKKGGFIRLDVDTSGYSSDDMNRITIFKTKFTNIKFKVFNSKEEQEKENEIINNHAEMISRPIKEVVLELCDGKITEEVYDFFFPQED